MYKCKLQELCQRRSWELPEYSIVKDGPDHKPRFTATVNVHGEVFETPAQCKSTKEAQNTAAQIAFVHFSAPSLPPQVHFRQPEYTSSPDAGKSQLLGFSPDAPPPMVSPVVSRSEVQLVAAAVPLFPLSPLPSSLPTPPPGLLATKNANNTVRASGEVLQQNCVDTTQSSMVCTVAIGSDDQNYKGGPAISECGVADRSAQSIQFTAPIRKHHDATFEDDNRQAKRAKTSTESMNVNTHLPRASQGNYVSDDSTWHPQPDEEQLFLRSKTVVYPKPECSSVLPFSDDQWITYKVKQEQEPTA